MVIEPIRPFLSWLHIRWKESASFPAATIWLGGYLMVFLTGVDFNTSYLDYGWQLVPWDVLSADPIKSVWYLHVQPPLWNLALGLPAWISPFSDARTLQTVMLFIGLMAVALTARLGEVLGLKRRSAIVVAVVATLHPEVLKGAFEPNYELAVTALLLAILVFAAGVLRARRASLLWLAIGSTALVMTRSLYHPLFAVLILALIFWRMRQSFDRRTVVAVASIPLLFVGGWMAKNQVLFGTPNLSSWFGMNLQRAVIPVLDREDLLAMHAAGQVSDVALIGPFEPFTYYEEIMPSCEPSRSFRGLSEASRTTDPESPNFNYECFIPVFEQAGRDAWAVIREHPDAWWEGRMWSLRTTIAVATSPSDSESWAMRALDDAYSLLRLDYRGALSTLGWGSSFYGSFSVPADFSILLAVVYPALGLRGLYLVFLRIKRQRLTDRQVIEALAVLSIAYTVLVGAVAELGEQSRFRTVLDPVATVLVGAGLVRWWTSRRGRHPTRTQ